MQRRIMNLLRCWWFGILAGCLRRMWFGVLNGCMCSFISISSSLPFIITYFQPFTLTLTSYCFLIERLHLPPHPCSLHSSYSPPQSSSSPHGPSNPPLPPHLTPPLKAQTHNPRPVPTGHTLLTHIQISTLIMLKKEWRTFLLPLWWCSCREVSWFIRGRLESWSGQHQAGPGRSYPMCGRQNLYPF